MEFSATWRMQCTANKGGAYGIHKIAARVRDDVYPNGVCNRTTGPAAAKHCANKHDGEGSTAVGRQGSAHEYRNTGEAEPPQSSRAHVERTKSSIRSRRQEFYANFPGYSGTRAVGVRAQTSRMAQRKRKSSLKDNNGCPGHRTHYSNHVLRSDKRRFATPGRGQIPSLIADLEFRYRTTVAARPRNPSPRRKTESVEAG